MFPAQGGADLQARLFDYSARFNEAAQRYHELSFDTAIDEEDRAHMLSAEYSMPRW